jgi:hypothetical protein
MPKNKWKFWGKSMRNLVHVHVDACIIEVPHTEVHKKCEKSCWKLTNMEGRLFREDLWTS